MSQKLLDTLQCSRACPYNIFIIYPSKKPNWYRPYGWGQMNALACHGPGIIIQHQSATCNLFLWWKINPICFAGIWDIRMLTYRDSSLKSGLRHYFQQSNSRLMTEGQVIPWTSTLSISMISESYWSYLS